ncbi:MAG: S9 family peptidase [candidate division KSB1 bacterium]|nr:S9 family peptidase [candidate division KSB1 bacterium]MDZ7342834.1 S9 family peptidase [candidate division KSB1 bacterium]
MVKFSIIKYAIIFIIWLFIFSPAFSQRSLTMADFYKIKYARTPKISPDGQSVIFVVNQMDSVTNSYRNQIWMVPTFGGVERAITDSETSNHSPEWSPDGKTIAMVSNASGQSQIWLLNLATGERQQLTDLPGGAWSPVWSPDGKTIAFLSETKFEGRNPAGLYDIKLYTHLRYRWWYDSNRYDEGWRSHIFIIDVVTKEILQLTDGDWFDDEICFSPDGKWLAFVSNRTPDRENNIDTDIWRVPISGGTAEKVFDNTGPDYSPAFAPNGRYLAWRSTFRYNYESDNYDLMIKDLKSGKVTNLTEAFDRVIYDLKWHANSNDIIFLAGDHGNYHLYNINIGKKKIAQLVEGRHRIRHWDISQDGKIVVMSRSQVDLPDEIFAIPYGKKTMRRLSHRNDDFLQKVHLQDAVTFHFIGDQGTTIEGWYITPPQFDPAQKYPMILNIHGGPQLMYANQFDFEFQLTAANGYIVFYANPRGSFGYGQAFTDAIHQDYGGSCYRDLMAGVDSLIALGFVDEKRLGVTGLSFGGWMTTWIIGHTDRFSAAIPVAPFVNMFSFYGTTDEQFFPEWDFGGQPYSSDIRAVYENNSPLNWAANFKTPTLILHGEADWRCHITEGEQLFTALKKMGVPAVLARFPNEPHVFEQPHHIEASLRLKLDWWQKFLSQ